MMPLALRVPPSPREMPTSYISRLAARNLSPDIWTFCLDTGLDFTAITVGDAAAVKHLCALAGIPDDTFANTTVIKTSSMRYLLGAEVMNTETLARGELRYCPTCLTEAQRERRKSWDVVHELHWQVIQIRRCCRHGSALEGYRPVEDRAGRFDFTALVNTVRNPPGGDAPQIAPTADALDRYLTERIYGNRQHSWCDQLEIPALIKACEAFGVLMDHGRDMRASYLDGSQRRDAMLTGFGILDAGPTGIRQALDRYNTRTPTRGGNQPHPSNGEVQRLLGSPAKLRPDLNPVRDIVRQYFLEHYPFKLGTTVLGQKVIETAVFSLRGASREIGVRGSLLEEILVQHGHAERDNEGRFILKAVLSRPLIESIRAEKDDYFDQNQTAAFLGCSFAMLKQLQRNEVLKPAEGDGRRMRKGYHRTSLQTFLDQISEGAERVERPGPDLCSLELATRKARCSVPDIVRLMLDSKVRARARLSDDVRLDTLVVSIADIKRGLCTAKSNGHSFIYAKRRLCVDGRTLDILVEQGFIETKRMRHSVTRVTRTYVTVDSLTNFGREYCTLGMFARENRMDAGLVRRMMREAGVLPVADVRGLRAVYRRSDMARDHRKVRPSHRSNPATKIPT